MANHNPNEFGPFLSQRPEPWDTDTVRRALLALIVSLAALAALLGYASTSNGAWGPSGCSTPASVEANAWYLANDGLWYHRSGRTVTDRWSADSLRFEHWDGFRWTDQGLWRWDNGSWSRASSIEAAEVPNFGVETDKIHGPPFSISGVEKTRTEVRDALTTPWPDESGKSRITAVGPPAFTSRVVSDLSAVDASKFVIKAYPADSWVVRDRLFLNESPLFKGEAVVLQDADGFAYHVQYGWADGDASAVTSDDFRKIPDLRKDADDIAKVGDRIKELLDESRRRAADLEAPIEEARRAIVAAREAAERLGTATVTANSLLSKLDALTSDLRAAEEWVKSHGLLVLVVLVGGGVLIYKSRQGSI